MRRVEDMHHTDFIQVLHYAENDEVVADGIASIPHVGQDRIAAQLMRGGKLCKRSVARLDAISKLCRGLRVFEVVSDVLERIEKVGIGRW